MDNLNFVYDIQNLSTIFVFSMIWMSGFIGVITTCLLRNNIQKEIVYIMGLCFLIMFISIFGIYLCMPDEIQYTAHDAFYVSKIIFK